jgi:riboflavin synthase
VFSGIVETVSPVQDILDSPGQRILSIRTPRGWRPRLGESIAVDGVCSTVQKIGQKAGARTFSVVYMHETLRRTTLGKLRADDGVNLERSLRLNSLIGGHLVQGHVDAVARIASVRPAVGPDGEACIYRFQLPVRYARYVAAKGSVALDGISLTVVDVRRGWFSVSLLAYTLSRTTLGRKGPGDFVNLEVDLLAKYVERLMRR